MALDDYADGLPDREKIAESSRSLDRSEQGRSRTVFLERCPAEEWEAARELWEIITELDVPPADVDYERLREWYERQEDR